MRLRSLCACVAAFAVPLVVYVASLRTGIAYWDSGELQTVPYILGIPHPSGFPAYVLVGWLWSHLTPWGDPAYRMNLLSAVAMSAAALTVAAALLELAVEPLFAGGAALVFGVSWIPWGHATHADVHPLALAAIGASFWSALRWRRRGSQRALVGCALAAAFALAVHSGTVLIVPGIMLVALGRRPSLACAATSVGLAAAVVVGFYAYLPLRSAAVYAQRLDPTLELGLPPGRPFWDNDHPSSADGFKAEVEGSDFGAGHALTRLVDPVILAKLPDWYGRRTVGDLAGGVLLIVLVGVAVLLARAPMSALGLLGGSFLPVLFVLAYPAESDPERYFLPSSWAIGMFLGVGADALARGGLTRAPRAVAAVVAALFLFVVGSDLYVNRAAFEAGRDDGGDAFVERVRRATPDDGIVVAPWMYATPLAYAAYVQRSLGHRTIVTGWPQDYIGWYPRWLPRRPITFVSDEPVLAVAGLRVREADFFGPAPHLFRALDILP